MVKRFLVLTGTVLFAATLISAANVGTWTGVVSDSHCGLKHSVASAEAAACVTRCVSRGASYVFVSDGKLYQVKPQDKFKGLAGKAVTVKGTLDGDTITVESVEAGASQ